MWEITLIGNKKDLIHFAMLEDILKSSFESPPIVAISYSNDLLCSIAVQDKKNIGLVKKCILETIIKICKEEYFKENIKILGSDKELNNFIVMSLTYIDLQDEIDYAKVMVKFSKTIHIRSLVNFRLNKLYSIWEKFVSYFNFSLHNIVQDQIYLEFLKFLANNTLSKTDIMYLEEDTSNMYILDKNRKVLKLSPKSDEIGLIVSLIVYSPKKLIVNCLDSLSGKVAGLIKYIFEDKVCVLL